MSYMSAGNMLEYESLTQLGTILTSNGWTWLTALCVMIFTLMHFPCGQLCGQYKRKLRISVGH